MIYIVENLLLKEDLCNLYEKSELLLKKFFNISGMCYCEFGLKDKLKDVSEDEMYEFLVFDGMLIKCLIVIDGMNVIFGFNEE